MNRKQRSEIGSQTLEILRRKEYVHPTLHNQTVSIASAIETSCVGTVVLDKTTTETWLKNANKEIEDQSSSIRPNISVVNATTFAAAKEIMMEQKEETTSLCCLNFASAKNPGGGFLKGSQAQEESLARASGLYACLLKAPTYYEANCRQTCVRGIYEDLIIYSPQVPVFRDDNDELIEIPWETAIITAPAPNAGVVMQKKLSEKERNEAKKILHAAFKGRIMMVLSTAMKFGHRHVVLGAWGCGVFQNDPKVVAEFFKSALMKRCFEGAFDTVVFAVLDRSKSCQTFNAFHEVFSEDRKSVV